MWLCCIDDFFLVYSGVIGVGFYGNEETHKGVLKLATAGEDADITTHHMQTQVGSKLLFCFKLPWSLLLTKGLAHNKSSLVQVMACCQQATSHYLNQWWPRCCMESQGHNELKHWSQNKITAILQTTIASAFFLTNLSPIVLPLLPLMAIEQLETWCCVTLMKTFIFLQIFISLLLHVWPDRISLQTWLSRSCMKSFTVITYCWGIMLVDQLQIHSLFW